ncbi:MAG: hydrogenase nickel incorporation protein HypB [Actinomycetota bacterium]|nr:hydrogenase nickel incorporation protein HypB [Actinomycetota bacterium]
MCATCGCGNDEGTRVSTMHAHDHGDHGHHHTHEQGSAAPDDTQTRTLELDILAKNDALAATNRHWLEQRRIIALNLMSSPGSGKTTLLVRTLTDLGTQVSVAVIEGDQETLLDADRIHATGAPVVQVNTGAGCHLDADMMRKALGSLELQSGSLLFVENVGNLVCPAMFDLGETAKVVVISVTEGDDKPLKYPQMFAGADLLVINKCDLLPYVDFDVAACTEHARRVNPGLDVVVISATTGEGLSAWYAWLHDQGPGDSVDHTY